MSLNWDYIHVTISRHKKATGIMRVRCKTCNRYIDCVVHVWKDQLINPVPVFEHLALCKEMRYETNNR